MDSYAAAGIPPAAILDAATVNGARWFGKQDDFGSIAVGRRADLILLDGDLMKDVKNFRKVAVVIKDSRVVARNEVAPEGAGRSW